MRVRPGEKYRGSVWAKAAATSGASWLALEFSATDYRPVVTAKSMPAASETGWQHLSVEAAAPESARWLRVILHGGGSDGATWYDNAEVVRVP